VGHAFVGALGCVSLVFLGRRSSTARAGAIAGAVAAVYAPFLYLDGMLEKNAFTIATLMWALVAFPDAGMVSARGWRRAAMSGFLLGCGALLRGNYLLLIPALGAALAWEWRGRGAARALAGAALFVGSALAPIAPFTIHNYRASGDFILTTAQSGTVLYLGNNPENSSGGIHALSFNRQIPEFEADDWKREAERRVGRAMTRKEVSAFWFGAAWGHITKDPGLGWWAVLLARKAELIVNRYEIPDNTTIEYVGRLSPLVGRNPVRFATMAPVGLLGLLWMLAGWRRRAPFLLACAVYEATLLLFPISDRFRAPFAAFTIVGFGAMADAIWTWARSQQWRKVAAAGAGIAAMAVVVNHDPWLQPANTNIRPQNALLKGVHDEAEAWIGAGEWDRAERVLRAAMKDPWLAKKARLNLDLARVRWYGRHDLAGAHALTSKSVKALMDEGESVPAGYQLYSEVTRAQGYGDVADYWEARAEAASTSDPAGLAARASQLSKAGDSSRAMGRARPAAEPPAEAYVQLARLLLARGDRVRAADVVKALAARGGVVPGDLAAMAQ
jgi:hypothetical protein